MGERRHTGRAGLGGLSHLSSRFLDAVRAAPPDPIQEARLRELLSDAESKLFDSMNAADRRHAVHGAAFVMDERPSREAVVAAALHDVGKVPAALGTSGRVTASLVTLVLGRRRTIELAGRGGVRGQIGAYADHPSRGAEMLARANASTLAQTWAREHHNPIEESSLRDELTELLWQADRS